MKPIHFHLRETLLAATFSFAIYDVSPAQSVTTTTTKETATAQGAEGTIRSLESGALVIQESENEKPLTYRYAQNFQYVDEQGNVVKREMLLPGTPVTVHYLRSGEGLLASQVVVHQSVAKAAAVDPATGAATSTSTTTTTTEAVKRTTVEGIVGIWQADRFDLKTVKDGTATFLYHKDTEFVDADGQHVGIKSMKPGLPVTVNFEQEGDRLVANRVTVNVRTVEPTR